VQNQTLNLRLTVLAVSAGIRCSYPSERHTVEPLPEFGSLTDEQLKAMIGDLEQQERDVSYQRRLLHGKIDILRAELVARLRASGGRSVLDQLDVDRLTEILTGKAAPEA
jgi:hypothetical protein